MPELLTTTVSLKDHRDWRPNNLPAGVVYIGRACYRGGWRLPAHPLANPYTVGQQYGLYESLKRYARWVSADSGRVALAESLRCAVLACFCQAGAPCHRGIVAAVADGRLDDIQAVLEWARGGGR